MAGKLSKKQMLAICDRLATGKSLRSICDIDAKMPHWVTVLQAVQRDEELLKFNAGELRSTRLNGRLPDSNQEASVTRLKTQQRAMRLF